MVNRNAFADEGVAPWPSGARAAGPSSTPAGNGGHRDPLDVLRALGRGSEPAAAVLAQLEAARGADSRYDAALTRLRAEPADPEDLAFRARRLSSLIALCLQGSLLSRHAAPGVADPFCATRLGGDWSPVLGSLPPVSPVSALVGRATVGLDG